MKLGKPPIVEVSIKLQFESSPGETEWDFTRAAEFIDQFQAEYPRTEVGAVASQQQFEEVQKYVRGKKPLNIPTRVPIAVRAFSTNRSRCLFNAKDLLQCIFIRTKENDYPGFHALKAETLRKLDAYREFFRPANLIGFVLQYVDFFHLPVVNQKAELKEYFTLCKEPDEAIFGTTIIYRNAFMTRPPNSEDFLTCELFNLPKIGKDSHPGIPFRMF
jgi:uncharacterized protein (TIGR04255 family)